MANSRRETVSIGQTARLVVLTGMSGAGKSEAIRALEDLGYFCVDNLPTSLIPTFADLLTQSGETTVERVAVVVDMRDPGFLRGFAGVLRRAQTPKIAGGGPHLSRG